MIFAPDIIGKKTKTMTAQEKAQELQNTFQCLHIREEEAILSSLICLQQMRTVLPFTDLNTSLGKYCEQQRNYLDEVKEILISYQEKLVDKPAESPVEWLIDKLYDLDIRVTDSGEYGLPLYEAFKRAREKEKEYLEKLKDFDTWKEWKNS